MCIRDRSKSLVADKPSGGRKDPVNDGLILIEVDDVLEGGNQRHRDLMEKFYKTYKCGRRKKLLDLGDEGTLISGIRTRQHKDKSFSWDMNEYTLTKLVEIVPPRGLISSPGPLSEEWMKQVESCNGKIGWLGGNGRPDVAAGHSIIAGQKKRR